MQNIFADIPQHLDAEEITILLSTSDIRIERIVSTGQASPEGFWYYQDNAEWVVLLCGSAALQFEGEAEPRILRAGDAVLIPAHARHRVAWTEAAEPTVWLAVHHA
jgi:cupin 2 domain-containing protein